MKQGAQLLSIGKGCNEKGIILHEMLHALGFWHEQSRTDRDDYIHVLWENVDKGKLIQEYLVCLILLKSKTITTSNSNHRLKSAFDMPICVLKRVDLFVFT